MPGLLIVFEGGEASGKTTQVQLLAECLRACCRIQPLVTREPGGTDISQDIRRIVLDGTPGGLSPKAEALLYAADRTQHVDTVIRPALEAGRVVISDRYVDSSLAYQAAGRALDAETVANLSRLVPDLTVLLDIHPERGLERARGRGALNRIEVEAAAFHGAVRAEYLRLAACEARRYLILDAERDRDVIGEDVWARAAPMLRTLEAVA